MKKIIFCDPCHKNHDLFFFFICLKIQKISCMLLNETDPKGAIAMYGNEVTILSGQLTNPDRPVSNLRKYDNSLFANCEDINPPSESYTYITFDFGTSKRIDLHSYLIRSNSNVPFRSPHPKTWRIEGSNDTSVWTPLDRRENDDILNCIFKQHHFVCKLSRNGDASNRYRYIRYVQQDSWWDFHPYCVFISYFELYGDVFGNY